MEDEIKQSFNSVKRVETRDKIMGVAIELFADKGFAGTSIRDICNEADVNLSMVSYYFAGKDGLYRAILDELFNKQIEYVNTYFNLEEFKGMTHYQKKEKFLFLLDKMVDFLYTQMTDKLMVFLIKEQQKTDTAFVPPIVSLTRKILANILNLDEDSREIVYTTLFLISQINSSRISNIFLKPYGQGKFEEVDIDYIKLNVRNYAKMIFQPEYFKNISSAGVVTEYFSEVGNNTEEQAEVEVTDAVGGEKPSWLKRMFH